MPRTLWRWGHVHPAICTDRISGTGLQFERASVICEPAVHVLAIQSQFTNHPPNEFCREEILFREEVDQGALGNTRYEKGMHGFDTGFVGIEIAGFE